MKVVVISNRKGGVGKTSVAANLANEIRKQELLTVMIDMDSQCDLTKVYLDQNHQLPTILDVLQGTTTLDNACHEVRPNLYLIPGDQNLNNFNYQKSWMLLKTLLNESQEIMGNVDIVIIDTPPGVNDTAKMAFAAADHVLLVTNPETFGMENMGLMINEVNKIQQSINKRLSVLGIVVNKVDSRRSLAKNSLINLKAVVTEIILEFKNHLIADGKSPAIIASYFGDVEHFKQYLEGKGISLQAQMKRFHVTNYRKHLLDNGYQINTINKKINSLQCFNHFLITNKLMNELVVDLKKDKVKLANGSEKEVSILTEAQVEKLLFHVQDNTKVSTRDKLIIYLLLFTGVRVTELVTIKLKDLDFLTMQLTVTGKGGKQRDIPLKSEVIEATREYLELECKHNKHASSEYLLLTQRASKMDRDAVNKMIRRLGRELGIPMHPHKFRHTFCTRLLKRGIELTTVAKLAGHAGINTTASFYINTSREDKLNAVNVL